MRSHDLSSTLQRILLATLAASLPGCGGIDTDAFEVVGCAPGDYQPDFLTGMNPSRAFDYVELRRGEGVGEGAPLTKVVQRFGTACASATDAAACAEAIAAAAPTEGFPLGQCVDFCERGALVLNRGDEVVVLTDTAGVLELLGTVDTASEAVLRVALDGYSVRCDDPERGGVRAAGDGYEVLATRYTASCDPVEVTLYRLGVSSGGQVSTLESEVIESESGVCIGRRPSCHTRVRAKGKSELGAYFASVAHLEDAAALAFAELTRELEHHGAPRSLVERAARSRREEQRHTRMMRALARGFGGSPPRARSTKRPVRSLEQIALHNAAEGCVRETFGALVGLWQASRARDARVRAVMRCVARDELRHAELSWDLDAWARSQLSAEACSRLDEARRAALAELEAEATAEVDPSLVEQAGLPTPQQSQQLLESFAAQLA